MLDILEKTRLTQNQFAHLTGRVERTVNQHVNDGVIPDSFVFWLDSIEEIQTRSGQAVIVLAMPYRTPIGEYRRIGRKQKKQPVQSNGL